MTPELGFTIKDVICAAFIIGYMWAEFRAIRKDIARLEHKQDKYNTLQERTLKLEIWKKEHEQCTKNG